MGGCIICPTPALAMLPARPGILDAANEPSVGAPGAVPPTNDGALISGMGNGFAVSVGTGAGANCCAPYPATPLTAPPAPPIAAARSGFSPLSAAPAAPSPAPTSDFWRMPVAVVPIVSGMARRDCSALEAKLGASEATSAPTPATAGTAAPAASVAGAATLAPTWAAVPAAEP